MDFDQFTRLTGALAVPLLIAMLTYRGTRQFYHRVKHAAEIHKTWKEADAPSEAREAWARLLTAEVHALGGGRRSVEIRSAQTSVYWGAILSLVAVLAPAFARYFSPHDNAAMDFATMAALVLLCVGGVGVIMGILCLIWWTLLGRSDRPALRR